MAENSETTAKRKRGPGKPFPKGVSGNPGGRPKNDLAKIIAQAVFESNPEGIREAFEKALRKGNSHVFKELADRAYGKITDVQELTVSYTEALSKMRAKRES